MKSKKLYRNGNQFLRVLRENEEMVLVTDCVKMTMPKWDSKGCLKEYALCEEQELWEVLQISLPEQEELTEEEKKTMNERYSMISGIMTFLGNQDLRNQSIRLVAEENNLSKQTIRSFIRQYVALNDIRALAPRRREEKPLTADEKNMRWALNKFYYTLNKNTLKNAYTLMLREKYCDGMGKLLEDYPSYDRFRYFYRKTKNLQKLYITREGLAVYQRNKRPLLGEGVTEFAPAIGTAMLDSTICDIYLVNEANQIVGRPILTACIDVCSGMCLGYSLTWEGGMYSLRNLMLNVIADKKEHCKGFGIHIDTEDWNVSELPIRLVTDKGSEYKSENFEQLAEFGISIINLPAYRPELKGPVEKFFDCVQGYYKPYLKGKGVIEPDFQQRGRHDYRKDAALTLREFEKVLLHCILFYNTKRVLHDYPFSEEELADNVAPYSNVIWNRGKEEGAELIEVEAEKLVKMLLPRTEGRFKRNGLWVNGLRYKNPNYCEAYLQGKEVTVAYNPDDVNKVWLVENGSFVAFELIESRFKDRELVSVMKMKQKQSELEKQEQRNMTQAEVLLAEQILTVRSQADKPSKKAVKNIRQARQTEQMKAHKDYMKGVM